MFLSLATFVRGTPDHHHDVRLSLRIISMYNMSILANPWAPGWIWWGRLRRLRRRHRRYGCGTTTSTTGWVCRSFWCIICLYMSIYWASWVWGWWRPSCRRWRRRRWSGGGQTTSRTSGTCPTTYHGHSLTLVHTRSQSLTRSIQDLPFGR